MVFCLMGSVSCDRGLFLVSILKQFQKYCHFAEMHKNNYKKNVQIAMVINSINKMNNHLSIKIIQIRMDFNLITSER